MDFKQYIFVRLKRNPEYIKQSEEHYQSLFAGHFNFIDENIKAGNLYIAGPLDKAGGLYFFNANLGKEKVQELLKEDLTIKAGVFNTEVHFVYFKADEMNFTNDKNPIITSSE